MIVEVVTKDHPVLDTVSASCYWLVHGIDVVISLQAQAQDIWERPRFR